MKNTTNNNDTLTLTLASWFAFLVDLCYLNSKDNTPKDMPGKPTLITLRDKLMSSLVITLCTFIPALYWGTNVAGLEGINPQFPNPLGWYNHAVHSIPFLYAYLLTKFVNYTFVPFGSAFMQVLGANVAYGAWVWWCFRTNKSVWAYGCLKRLGLGGFVGFVETCAALSYILHCVMRRLAYHTWTKESLKKYKNE